MFSDVLKVLSGAQRCFIDVLRCVQDVLRYSQMLSRCSQDFFTMFLGCSHDRKFHFDSTCAGTFLVQIDQRSKIKG